MSLTGFVCSGLPHPSRWSLQPHADKCTHWLPQLGQLNTGHASVQWNWRACTTSVGSSSEPSGVEEQLVKMPKLYDAWFPPTHEIAHQMRAAVRAALADGKYKMELTWPCVPNLEEIKFGTKNNFEFGKFVSRVLGMDAKEDYPLIKRYLGEFSNLYWVTELAKAFPERVVWCVSVDGVSKVRAEPRLGNVKLASLKRGQEPDAQEGDVIVIVDPRSTDTWVAGAKLQPSETSPVIFLNSEFNETYGLVGPRKGLLKDIESVYFVKRITRGFVFRSYPQPWQAVLENPDCSCEILASYDQEPRLNVVAKIVRETSNNRYGFLNDRYAKGFGGRL